MPDYLHATHIDATADQIYLVECNTCGIIGRFPYRAEAEILAADHPLVDR